MGRRILIVEDEALIALLLTELIDDLGGTWIAATNLADAFALANVEQFDLAILDMNLMGEMVWPVADALKTRGIPFVIATGYEDESIADAYRDSPRVLKPYLPEQIGEVLIDTLAALERDL